MKRFTETDKWKDMWFRKLKVHQKLLWMYVCDNCDHAGVIDLDIELASFQIGAEIKKTDLESFGDRIESLGGNKIWLKKFVRFQYGKLSRDCKPHAPVFVAMEKHGFSIDDMIQNENFKGSIDGRLREKIIERDGLVCVYYNIPISADDAHIDHIVPKVKGGSNDPSNLVVASKKANSEKWDLSLDEYCQKANLNLNEVKNRINERLSKASKVGFQSLQDKEKEKEEEEEKEKEGGVGEKMNRFEKPTLDMVKLAMAKAGLPDSEAERFINYYESNGWRVGKNPMRKWTGAIGTWAANYRTNRFNSNGQPSPTHTTPKTKEQLDREMLLEAMR